MTKNYVAIKEVSNFFPVSEMTYRRLMKEADEVGFDVGARRVGLGRGKIIILPEIFEAWIRDRKVTYDRND